MKSFYFTNTNLKRVEEVGHEKFKSQAIFKSIIINWLVPVHFKKLTYCAPVKIYSAENPQLWSFLKHILASVLKNRLHILFYILTLLHT